MRVICINTNFEETGLKIGKYYNVYYDYDDCYWISISENHIKKYIKHSHEDLYSHVDKFREYFCTEKELRKNKINYLEKYNES